MNYPSHVEKANDILRDLDGVFPGYIPPDGKFQLKHRDELVSLVPEYIDNGYGQMEPVYDYLCGCGLNIQVHNLECDSSAVARIRLQKVSMFGLGGQFPSFRYVQWALCNWQPPPAKEDWARSMGTERDYPANGRYLPVHRGPLPIVIPPSTPPDMYVPWARVVVNRMTEHTLTFEESLKKEDEKSKALKVPIFDSRGNVIREPDRNAKYWQIKDRIKEKMRHFNPTGTVGYTKAIAAQEKI